VSNSIGKITNTLTTTDSATCENIQQLVDMGLKLKPDNIKILTNAGKNLAQKCGKYQESISYFDRALKIDINYVPALYNKGVSLEKLGNNDEAQQLFEKAKLLDPTYGGDFILGAPRLSKPLPSPI
jgi:tetratricopeptide (TPR) repeat protein